jgi:hypothetical protein
MLVETFIGNKLFASRVFLGLTVKQVVFSPMLLGFLFAVVVRSIILLTILSNVL